MSEVSKDLEWTLLISDWHESENFQDEPLILSQFKLRLSVETSRSEPLQPGQKESDEIRD